ncbi:MAG: hypothetical protein JST00_24960 [Deltaproteobacteria bacterium]|nr:hypothetical protein [Deltaproteobacteria bacterium]
MPEPTVLYSVTVAVVVGLAAWVAVVLKNAKEPWTRDVPPPPASEASADAPLVTDDDAKKDAEEKKRDSAPVSSSLPKVATGGTSAGADVTAPATAVVLAKKADEKKADENAADEKPGENAAGGDAEADDKADDKASSEKTEKSDA